MSRASAGGSVQPLQPGQNSALHGSDKDLYGCANQSLLPPASDLYAGRCQYDRRRQDRRCAGCDYRDRDSPAKP